VINKHADEAKVRDCWEMSTYGSTLIYLKANFEHIFESEFFSDKEPGSIIDGILNQDVQSLTFQNSSLDLITSNQVFEHVPNDVKGYQECYRVLRPGGALIFSVPLYSSHQTKKLAEIVEGDLVFHEEPEYHDSRLGGPKSALTFWRHSKNDICSRVSSAGFNTKLEEVFLTPNQRFPSLVVYAKKSKQTPPQP
jgi:SAM-dependent methyltransferase